MSVDPLLIDIPEELVGENVIVRPYRIGDAQAFYDAIDESREHLAHMMSWAQEWTSISDADLSVRRAMSKWISRQDLIQGVWDKATGRYVGGVGLHQINWDIPSFMLAYWIRRSEEGRGYISDAVTLVRNMAFDHLNANRLYATVASHNLRSIAVATRTGFVHELTMRQNARDATGQIYDTQMFAITRDDFINLRRLGNP
jgi:RimJ/RimL family protein N-acetyltransferase